MEKEKLELAKPSRYQEYMNSNAYKVNHHEPFENRKDSPAFFFVG